MDSVNNAIVNNRVLKKVKRPINRMPQTAPSMQSMGREDVVTQTEEMHQADKITIKDNPFIQQQNAPSSALDTNDFDLDAFLDGDNLPSTQNTLPDEDYDLSSEQNSALQKSNYIANDVQISKKLMFLVGSSLLLLGIIIGKFVFTESKIIRNGLQGVVINSEVPKGRARCGVAERTQGCVLYIMNPQRQEMYAKDFYDMASQLTGRQRFVIETGNMRYANQKIRPGEIVQFNIPPL